MIRIAVRIILVLVFSTNFIFAESVKVDSLLKAASQQVKSSKFEKAVQTLNKTEKNSKTESEKTEIDKLYQLIIKAYLRDLDYVSAFDIQKKRITNLTELYEVKSQKKIDALEKKLQNNSKQPIKEKKKKEEDKKVDADIGNDTPSRFSPLLIVIIVVLLVALIFVFVIKTKIISELKNQPKQNNLQEDSSSLKTNSNDYKMVELNNKINYLQQQISIKNEEVTSLNNTNANLVDDTVELKKELLKKENLILSFKEIVPTHQISTPTVSLEKYILPRSEFLKHLFPNHFIFKKSTSNVSSNLYWFDSIEGRVYFAMLQIKNNTEAALNYLFFSMLNRSIHEYGKEKPAEILRQINTSWLEFLTIEDNSDLNKLEITMSVCCYNIFSKQLEYAGANHSIFIIREKNLTKKALYILNADTDSICKQSAEKQFAFTNQIIETIHGDRLFLVNDIITNNNATFFNTTQLQNTFLKRADEPISDTYQELESEFDCLENKNGDILIIGIDL